MDDTRKHYLQKWFSEYYWLWLICAREQANPFTPDWEHVEIGVMRVLEAETILFKLKGADRIWSIEQSENDLGPELQLLSDEPIGPKSIFSMEALLRGLAKSSALQYIVTISHMPDERLNVLILKPSYMKQWQDLPTQALALHETTSRPIPSLEAT